MYYTICSYYDMIQLYDCYIPFPRGREGEEGKGGEEGQQCGV